MNWCEQQLDHPKGNGKAKSNSQINRINDKMDSLAQKGLDQTGKSVNINHIASDP